MHNKNACIQLFFRVNWLLIIKYLVETIFGFCFQAKCSFLCLNGQYTLKYLHKHVLSRTDDLILIVVKKDI